MRNKGRMIAWILITVLLCGQIPTQAYAQTQFTQTVSAGEDTEGTVDTINAGMVSGENAMQAGLGNEISMRGENSFGTMLSSQLSAEMAEQQENNGCNVFSVEMEGDAAIVSFESVQDAFLVIGIYDETGTELLTSGSLEIFAGETTAVVEFEEGSIPQYFYIKGYLVEAGTYRPLCSVYESPMYTQEMQEFLAKTTADFDADRVLNLDEYETNNFAVFAEETILISGDNGQNDVTMADESSNTYVIEDADSSITSLQPGDIFAYPYQENEVLIVKVANIVVDGTTVTITGADTAMEEVFDYIKIDAEMGSGEATVDASSCDDGVTYEGLVDYVDEGTPQTYGFEAGGSIEKAFKLKLDKEFSNIEGISVGISGGLEMKLKLSAKVYLTFTTQYVELKLDYSAKISADITGKANAEIPLVTVGFMFTGIIVELKPSIVIESKATISLDGTLSGTVGFRAEAGSGIINLTKAPKFTSQIKVEGSIFFGISLCPRVKILSDKVASASLTAKVGAEVKASYTYPIKQDEEKKHICTVCIAGEINGKFTISAELKFLNQAKLTITPVDLSMKISDFYYSADYDEFGWSSCPYYLLKGKIVVLDTSQQPIPNVRVTTNGEELTTNEQGTAEFWASAKQYTFSIEKEGFATVYRDLTLKKGGERLLVILLKANGDSGDTGDSEGGNSGESSGGNEDGSEIMPEEAILQVSLGESHSAVIMEGGDLYLCGANYEGELGDGTTTNSTIPKKIMSGVKEVSLGYYHSATITEGGDLYLWGDNYDGQLGDGTTTDSIIPKKIMSGVKEVSLGESHSAVITEEGDLYLWGYNHEGQLGDGTTTDSTIPKKIMSEVKEVSLGCSHSAAITEGGDLYLWGANYGGELGDGTTTDSIIPKKIMSGVKEVSLGAGHSAAITEGGDLYLWGGNYDGELGDGTTTDSTIPKKIMSEVKEVSLGCSHSAAITEGGDLYLWGGNYDGQLGDGTTTDSTIPKKIMSGVKEVSLGKSHSAAITEGGDLYLWGHNYDGQLGDGTTTTSTISKKINIPSITAITNDTPLFTASAINEILVASEQQSQWNGTNFTNLIPNETYNYYVMMNRYADTPFSTDNLLYIGQAVSDESGNLNVVFSSEVASAGEDIFAVPMHQIDLSDAKVTVEDLTYNGTQQYAKVVVSYQDTILVEGVDYNVVGDYGVTQTGDYTLTIEGIGLYTGTISASYRVLKENVAVTGITLNKSTLTLKDGETATLTATILPDDADNKNVTWSSNNVAVATVTNGTVTALKSGTVKITATTEDGKKTADCLITVTCAHAMTKTDAVSATCTKDGNITYYTCSKCGKKFTDKAGTKEAGNTVIKATGHTVVNKWESDSTAHWKACKNCNSKFDKANHSFQWVVDKTATEDVAGIKHEECACGRKRSEGTVIPKLDKVPAKEGWEEVNGQKFWYENGIKQGTEGRGKEIYDPETDAWYWLDAVQDGAVAVNKDVYQESYSAYPDRPDGTGKWVRYDENGRMVKGWQSTDAGIYYFEVITGSMAKGDVEIDGKRYYFNEDTGILEHRPEFADGWHEVDGTLYWYEGGKRQGWNPADESYRGKEIYDPVSDGWYWLDNVQNGAKAVSKDVYQESYSAYPDREDGTGKWGRYDANGRMIKGWQTTDAGTYYFEEVTGSMAKGHVTIDGAEYYFDEATGILR